MRKIVTLLVSLLFIYSISHGQITKGNFLVGGNASFASTKYNSSQSIPGTITTFQIFPNIGYFIADKLAGGIRFSFNSFNRINSFKSTALQLGPFARYYFLPTEKVVNLFTEFGYLYGHTTNQPSRTTNTFYLLAGPVIYFNSSVGMEFTVGYQSSKYTIATGRDNTIQVSLGFQIHLEKAN